MTDDLETVMAEARKVVAESAPPPEPAAETWEPLDLSGIVAGILDGTVSRPTPTVGMLSDGTYLFYAGRVNGLFGDSGDGKSWVALVTAAQEVAAKHHVIWIDFEDDEVGTVQRLLALGADPGGIVRCFHYLRPQEFFGLEAQTRFRSLVEGYHPSLVVVDSTGEAMSVDGTKPNDDDDVARWNRRFPRFMANLGPAVVLVDHLPKANGGALFAIGSQRKRAAITGAVFLVEATAEFGIARCGRSKLTTAKDRCGTHVRGARAADFVLDATTTPYDVTLSAPVNTTEGGTFRPTALMEKVSRYVELNPGITTRSIRTAIRGKTEYVILAVDLLVAEGYIATAPGPRRAVVHRSIQAFRAGEEGEL